MAARPQPALIVLDMGMPMLSGEEVAQEFKHALRNPPPVLVMSGASTIAKWATRVGAAGYLAQPFDIEDLLGTVERVIAEQSSRSLVA
jgi:DNA-binding response OmpR family regulator